MGVDTKWLAKQQEARMSEDIVEKMNQASLAESHIELKARIEELEAELLEAQMREIAALGQANDALYLSSRLQDTIREALRIMTQPHYGDVDTEIDHYLEAFDLLLAALEKETEK